MYQKLNKKKPYNHFINITFMFLKYVLKHAAKIRLICQKIAFDLLIGKYLQIN